MNRKYRIRIMAVLGIIAAILVLVCAFQYSYDKAQKRRLAERNQQEKTVQTEGSVNKEYGYLVKIQDGYVVIYYPDSKTVFEYTTISCKSLPQDVQEKINTGMYLPNVKQVYGFLENYSS